MPTWKDKPEPQPASRGGLKRPRPDAAAVATNVNNGASSDGPIVSEGGDVVKPTVDVTRSTVGTPAGLTPGVDEGAVREILSRPAEVQ